jgi:hypothetical protein
MAASLAYPAPDWESVLYIHCAFAEIRYWPSDQMQTATAATVGRIETAIGARPNTFMSSFVEAVADPRLRRSR